LSNGLDFAFAAADAITHLMPENEELLRHRLALRRAELAGLQARLANLNPRAVLQRGYAIVYRQPTNQIVTSTQSVTAGDALRIVVADGEFSGAVTAS
jgi:exodeoxyribonuclease VII large subunit